MICSDRKIVCFDVDYMGVLIWMIVDFGVSKIGILGVVLVFWCEWGPVEVFSGAHSAEILPSKLRKLSENLRTSKLRVQRGTTKQSNNFASNRDIEKTQ